MNPNILISTLVTREISIKAMSLLKINVNKLVRFMLSGIY